MDITLRPMTREERIYSYTQSSQIGSQTGNIGHFRADMDSGGESFFSTWFDFRKDLKTEEFKAELDDVINHFRFSDVPGRESEGFHDACTICRHVQFHVRRKGYYTE